MTLSASAAALKPGETLKYQYSAAWIEPIDPSTPAALLKAREHIPSQMSYSYSFTISADRVDDDGIAHAIIKMNMKSVRGWSLNEPFEANIMPDGEIVPKYDLTLLKAAGLDQNHSTVTPGYHPRTHEESVNFAAASFNMRLLGFFNDLALGASKKAPFKDGDTWRISIADKDEIMDFTYQGVRSDHGHEVAAIGFTTTRMTQNGVAPVTGNTLYDLNRHIVTLAHWVGDEDVQPGVRNVTVDIALQ